MLPQFVDFAFVETMPLERRQDALEQRQELGIVDAGGTFLAGGHDVHLRLAPEIQETILSLADGPNPPRLPEKALRPITRIEDDEKQAAAFADVIGRRA